VGPPSGTVTFLFTDIEGSTALWDGAPDAMREALALHDEIIRRAVDGHGGYVFATGGDGFAVAFHRAGDAVAAASDAQAALSAERWPAGIVLRVRMGLHTGEVEEREGDYFGTDVNRAARIMAAGHGGQVLVSSTTAGLVAVLPLIELGEHAFAGLETPERVFQVGGGSFAPLRSLGAVPSNLPVDRSVFVGRERELAFVAGLVRSARLVTLTGVGGVGKTRLAIQMAAGLAGEFPGGVWLAELAPLIDAALVPSAVSSAVGAPVVGHVDSTEAVCRFLAQRRSLLVLDNCEHVIDAAAELVDRLLSSAPRVRVLATSREALEVTGEAAWRVPSLSFDDDGDAVALFAERARHVQAGFSLDDPAVLRAAASICRRLDGIPLAIELAAARAKVLSVDQIAAHLDERFRLLTRGGRTAVARQQTLQGAIDWSYELLGARERDLFSTLGVFAGEFDLGAVVAVAGIDEFEALDTVEQLDGKSMLEVDAPRSRYRLLETLRQYAWDRLVADGRLVTARDAHAAYFSSLAGEQAKRMGEGGQQNAALDRLEADYDNLRAALAWLIEQQRADEAARMARRLIGLFNIRHPREGFDWFQEIIAIAGELPVASRSRLLGDTAFAAMNAGDLEGQYRYSTDAVTLSPDAPPAVAHYLLGQRELSRRIPRCAVAVEHLRRAVGRAVATGDLTTQALAVSQLAYVAALEGNGPETRRLVPEAIDLAERLGNPTILAVAYGSSASALSRIGERDTARGMFERGITHADSGGPIIRTAQRALYALTIDDPSEAARVLQDVIPVAKEQLGGYQQSLPLLAAAMIAAQSGGGLAAARLLGAFDQRGSGVIIFGEHDHYEQLVSRLKVQLGAPAFEDEFRGGAQLTTPDALRLAEEVIAGFA
jgi:predicted ATPase/class 3 adenylate cyclase